VKKKKKKLRSEQETTKQEISLHIESKKKEKK
jgi:hypothetical protein